MIKEIRYDSDIIEINTTSKTFSSKEDNKYDIIYSPEDGSIQFLIPQNKKYVSINADTGEVVELGNEDEIDF